MKSKKKVIEIIQALEKKEQKPVAKKLMEKRYHPLRGWFMREVKE